MHNMINEISFLRTGRITKIMESGDTDFIFTIRANHINYNLLLSFSSDFSRIHLTKKTYDFPLNPKSLTMFLRKHIEGYFIEDIYQYKNDRILIMRLGGYNEMKDFNYKYLICEIMGRYSNLILTDENYKILEVLKHTGITEFGRTMMVNASYIFPISNKLNPYDLSINELDELKIDSPKDMINKLEGISIFLANYCFKDEFCKEIFFNILHNNIKPSSFINTQNKEDYYIIPLNDDNTIYYNSLSELLDEYYYKADINAKIKQKTNDLVSFINRQINKNEKKIKKLEIEKLETKNALDYKIKGELLLSYPNLKTKEKKVSIFNYYNNENIIIDLDIKYDIITNSQKYFKKYQKAKTATIFIDEQINNALNEIEYFNILLDQLKCANINDALEIRQELIDNKYLIDNKTILKKKNKPNYLTYIVDDNLIFVGKNNIQNEYLTHRLAKPNDYWFHIQNASGSHVILNTSNLTENLIRTAAMLAANYSSLNLSSSIAVDYTQIRNIKKIPGKRNCFVTYTKQKTIYIDIDQEIIKSLKVKK